MLPTFDVQSTPVAASGVLGSYSGHPSGNAGRPLKGGVSGVQKRHIRVRDVVVWWAIYHYASIGCQLFRN